MLAGRCGRGAGSQRPARPSRHTSIGRRSDSHDHRAANASLNAARPRTLSFSVKNNNAASERRHVVQHRRQQQLQRAARASGNCDFTDTSILGQSKNFTVTLRAGNVAAGQTKRGEVRVVAEVGGDGRRREAGYDGPGPEAPQVQTVAEVRGPKVTAEATGDPVSGATGPDSTDRDNHSYTMNTNGSGNYRFNGSAGHRSRRATDDPGHQGRHHRHARR